MRDQLYTLQGYKLTRSLEQVFSVWDKYNSERHTGYNNVPKKSIF